MRLDCIDPSAIARGCQAVNPREGELETAAAATEAATETAAAAADSASAKSTTGSTALCTGLATDEVKGEDLADTVKVGRRRDPYVTAV